MSQKLLASVNCYRPKRINQCQIPKKLEAMKLSKKHDFLKLPYACLFARSHHPISSAAS